MPKATCNNAVVLPSRYSIAGLPVSIDFEIDGYEENYPRGVCKTLALGPFDCRRWFENTVDRVCAAVGKQYLPICRLSDGEFHFLLGDQPFDFRLPWERRLRLELGRLRERISLRGGIAPFTAGHYHSGEFSAAEWHSARREAPTLVRALSSTGILAWHFSYASEPFQERYFPALGRWLLESEIAISWNNYIPFYFVYPMLTGKRRGEIFEGKRVLVINGAEGEKKQAVIEGLKREGVSNVGWCPVSLRRSYYDTIDVSQFCGECDLALIGAGIGKLKIMQQLGSLNVPCIDAGFVFEVLADRKNRFKRVMCATDSEWQEMASSPGQKGI